MQPKAITNINVSFGSCREGMIKKFVKTVFMETSRKQKQTLNTKTATNVVSKLLPVSFCLLFKGAFYLSYVIYILS